MTRSKSIPPKDADFNSWQLRFTLIVLASMEKWRLDTNWINDRYIPASNAWNTCWAAYENPLTRNPTIINTKKRERKDYESLLSVLVSNLKVNTLVTDQDRFDLGIKVPDRKPTPTPTPTTFPVANFDLSMIRRITAHYRDSESITIAKPFGVHGAEIKWVISDEKPASDAAMNSSFDTRTPFTLEFEEEKRSKKVWMLFRWENTRGEKGPWSEMISATIP